MESKGAPLYVRILVVALAIVMCFFSIKNQKRKANDLKKRGRLTIGQTNGWNSNYRSSGYNLRYTYSFSRHIFNESITVSTLSGIKTKGEKYIVIFDPEHPRNSKLLLDMKVKHCYLDNFNDTGWIVIPNFVVLYPKDSFPQ